MRSSVFGKPDYEVSYIGKHAAPATGTVNPADLTAAVAAATSTKVDDSELATEQDRITALEAVDPNKADLSIVQAHFAGGEHVKSGGTTAEVYVKKSNTDYDCEWVAGVAGYDDTAISARVTTLEAAPDADTIYDDTAVTGRVTTLEAFDHTLSHDGAAQDTALATHIADAVAHVDTNTVYDDTAITGRVTVLETIDHTQLHDGAAQDTAIALKADQTALTAEITSTDTEQTAQDTRLTALEAAPPPLVDATPTDGSVNAVSSDGVFDALTAATNARALLVPKSDKADSAAVIAGTIDRWVDAAELKIALDLLDFAGDYQGSSATFAGLPASPTSGDWAILNIDDGPNLSGIYVTDGATYSLAKAIPDFVAGVLANFLSTDGDFAVPKSWSGQVLESWRHSNENFTALANGGTAEAGTGRAVDPGSTIAAPALRVDGTALVAGDYFQLALTADGAVTVTGVAETTTFTGLAASSHAWVYFGAAWIDLDPAISDLLTQAEIADSASTEEGTVTGALLHATFKPDIIVNTQADANTTSVLDGQRLQVGRGVNYLATYENISGSAQLATSANRADGSVFAPLHKWRGSMLSSNGGSPLIDDSNLYFSDWTIGIPAAPIRERSYYFVGIVQAIEAAWDGTQAIEWSFFQSMEDPGSPGTYIWIKERDQGGDAWLNVVDETHPGGLFPTRAQGTRLYDATSGDVYENVDGGITYQLVDKSGYDDGARFYHKTEGAIYVYSTATGLFTKESGASPKLWVLQDGGVGVSWTAEYSESTRLVGTGQTVVLPTPDASNFGKTAYVLNDSTSTWQIDTGSANTRKAGNAVNDPTTIISLEPNQLIAIISVDATNTVYKKDDGELTTANIVYPGNNGAVQIGKENVYYLDETVGTIPPAITGDEYAVSILQANTTDAQGVKDAAKAKVSHFRALDTGAGFIWIETEAADTTQKLWALQDGGVGVSWAANYGESTRLIGTAQTLVLPVPDASNFGKTAYILNDSTTSWSINVGSTNTRKAGNASNDAGTIISLGPNNLLAVISVDVSNTVYKRDDIGESPASLPIRHYSANGAISDEDQTAIFDVGASSMTIATSVVDRNILFAKTHAGAVTVLATTQEFTGVGGTSTDQTLSVNDLFKMGRLIGTAAGWNVFLD